MISLILSIAVGIIIAGIAVSAFESFIDEPSVFCTVVVVCAAIGFVGYWAIHA